MAANLSPPMSIDNIQLNLKQKININGRNIRGCSLLRSQGFDSTATSPNFGMLVAIVFRTVSIMHNSFV
jgi:hypothetical protein